MRLEMIYTVPYLDFVQNRLYVARTLVPAGLEWYFVEQARFVSAHTSTAIEGNQLSDTEAIQVLLSGANEEKADEVATVNLNEAYEMIGALAADSSTYIDEGLVRALNSIVLRNLPDFAAKTRGRYRERPNLIVDATTRAVRYRPPAPQFVPDLMDSLMQNLGKAKDAGVPGPILAAMAHFGVISIHPFEDGNGRTARLLADFTLQQSGWAADGMLSLSKATFDFRIDYYDVLRTTQGEDFKEEVDITPFITFQLKMMEAAAMKLEERVVTFSRTLSDFQKRLAPFLSPRQARGLAILADIGLAISSIHYARMMEVSQSSAIADLNELVKQKVLRIVGAGKATRYTLADSR